MDADSERRCIKLSNERKQASLLSKLKFLAAAIGYTSMLATIQVLPDNDAEIRFEGNLIGVIGVGLGSLGLFLFSVIRFQQLNPTGINKSIVEAFDAHTAVVDLIDRDLSQKARKRARKRLQDLSYEIFRWTRNHAPKSITAITDDLISSNISKKAVAIVENGEKKEIRDLVTLLDAFVERLVVGLTWEELKDFGNKFASLPDISSTKVQKEELFKQHRIIKYLWLPVVGGLILYFVEVQAFKMDAGNAFAQGVFAALTIIGVLAAIFYKR